MKTKIPDKDFILQSPIFVVHPTVVLTHDQIKNFFGKKNLEETIIRLPLIVNIIDFLIRFFSLLVLFSSLEKEKNLSLNVFNHTVK